MNMCENQDYLDIALPQTAIVCRTIIIGSYKCIPKGKVLISHSGVRFSVPLVENDTTFVTVDVKYRDIVKLLIHFGQTLPVLFFYMSISVGTRIRELLRMRDPNGLYYDPAGKALVHRRITLLLETLPEDSKAILTSIFSQGNKIVELSYQEANNLFIRAAPRDSLITWQPNENLAKITGVNDEQIITVYPPSPAKGGIAVSVTHYLCLAENEFLNDVIIDFYLKYLTLEVLSESDQRRTHMFSSFFYKRLTSPYAQDAQSTASMTRAAKRYARVQKWTKNVNIFEKDFVIIPINEYAHWFLAIICFPGLVGKISCIAKTSENDNHKTVQKSKKIKELKTVTFGSRTITAMPTTIIIDNESDKDEAEESKTKTNVKLEEQKEIVKIPCILIFDSLASTSRSSVIATLRDYLSCEYVAKFGVEKIFSKNTIKEAYPNVPQQSNSTDCGLYVLQYVESFFKNPIKDYNLSTETLKTWFKEIVVTRKREELSKLLIKLMNNTKEAKTINLPILNFPTQNGKLKTKKLKTCISLETQ